VTTRGKCYAILSVVLWIKNLRGELEPFGENKRRIVNRGGVISDIHAERIGISSSSHLRRPVICWERGDLDGMAKRLVVAFVAFS